MRVLIMGAGALGSVLGGFLAKAGYDVTLVGRATHMDAIRRSGLLITGIFGEHRVTENLTPVTAVDEADSGAFDTVFITVKSYDTGAAVGAVAPVVGEDTLVCSYQNGLGNAEIIAARFGWPRTIGARAIYGVWLPEPGRAEVTVIASPTALGVYDPATPVDRVKTLAAGMDAAGLPTVFTERFATLLWAKVAYNCALNPLSALLDAPYGRLLDTEETRAMMREVVEELYAVGRAMDVELEPADAAEYNRYLVEDLIPPTARHYASMREDFRLKRRTEIGALNEAIVRFGEQHGIQCPANAFLSRLIRARETLYLSERES